MKMDFPEFQSALNSLYSNSECQVIWKLITESDLQPEAALLRLKQHEPIQYILQSSWFYNRKFHVDNNTLIPRPETEELCDLVIKENKNFEGVIADIGTGSGCIAITLACELQRSNVIALDISELALQVAIKNATTYGVENRVHFEQADFLNAPIAHTSLNIIVSNPPYVDRKEMETIEPGVLNFEPYMALFPPGHNPLIFYVKLNELLIAQKQECVLYAEINPLYSKETLECFSPSFNRKILKDIIGKDRFIKIIKGD